jgi:transcription elongation factor GreB
MSRAFVKESDEDGGEDLPERPVPSHANYVTPKGLAQLQARVRELGASCEVLRREAADDTDARRNLRVQERDLRYFKAQLERAEVVTAAGDDDVVRFGAHVTLALDDGTDQRVHIVGDDEADVAAGEISWASPLARSLIGAREGDVVKWRRPAGESQVEILEVRYAA